MKFEHVEVFGKPALFYNWRISRFDGFIDWKAFGNHMMESEGITQTEYGLVRRASDPAPKQAMDVQPMQSPFF